MHEKWKEFFALPVSGDAKLLALRCAAEPHDPDLKPRNMRQECDLLRMQPWEYERAFQQLRDVRIGLMTSPEMDQAQVAADCWVRQLVDMKGKK